MTAPPPTAFAIQNSDAAENETRRITLHYNHFPFA